MSLKSLKSLLCPPGAGVYTVNTAKERKDQLHQTLYQTQGQEVETKWLEKLDEIDKNKKPLLLGVCSDTGGGILRGANWGPLFIRNEFYKSTIDKVLDIGDCRVIPHLLHDKYLNDETIQSCQQALFGKTNGLPVSPLSITYRVCDELYKHNGKTKVIALGGDHSVSYPLVKSYLESKQRENKNVAVIHFDAHTDLLRERLGIDLCFGSWATHIIPFLNRPSHLIQLGIRSSGKDKAHWEKEFGVQQFWANEIQDMGAAEVSQKILNYLEQEAIDELYVSFDIDAIDSSYASATGTPEEGGLFPHEALLILNQLGSQYEITGADLVEVAPFLNTNESGQEGMRTTLEVASSILEFYVEHMEK